MSIFLQFDGLIHNEIAKKAMESYVGVLQDAFEHHRKLWENYIKLQEKYEKKCDVHLSDETDTLCREIKKELVSQKQLNDYATAQEVGGPPLELDKVNTSFASVNSNEEISFSSPNKSSYKIAINYSPPSSPVFSRAHQKTGGTSAKKLQLFKAAASVHDNLSSDMKPHHSIKKTSAKCNPKLEISTSQHVETTILPNGKKLRQSRLVFHPAKCNEKKVFLPNINKPASILPKTEENSINNISVKKEILTLENDTTISNEIVEDVIEISPTQKNITSRVRNRLKLKRKAPTKQVTKCSPRKNNPDSSAVPEMTINNIDFALLPKYTSTQVEDIKMTKSTVDQLKNKANKSDFALAKTHNESQVPMAKSIKTEKESQSEINKVQSITQNTNDFVFEDETFYLPAEQVANKSNINSINLQDVENKPPDGKILLNKDIGRRKEDIPEQLNMRCKADRAKLDGWDCWECKQYYKNLSLSKEELQKRRNQCSRHRHRYERPNTPEGFWDPEFPETLSFTYRQNQN